MRILHTMIRVGDLDQSIAFYTEVLEMKLLRKKDYPDGRFTLAFVGYVDESVSVTHNLSASVAHKLSGLIITVEVIKDGTNKVVTGDTDYEI